MCCRPMHIRSDHTSEQSGWVQCSLVRVFEKISRSNHSCNANAFYDCNNERYPGHGTLVAQKDIIAGDPITIGYANSNNYSRHLRRAELKRRYCFDCQCEWCLQPTDSQRTIPCPCKTVTCYISPNDKSTEWAATLCGKTFSGSEVKGMKYEPAVQESQLEAKIYALDYKITHSGPPTSEDEVTDMLNMFFQTRQLLGCTHVATKVIAKIVFDIFRVLLRLNLSMRTRRTKDIKGYAETTATAMEDIEGYYVYHGLESVFLSREARGSWLEAKKLLKECKKRKIVRRLPTFTF